MQHFSDNPEIKAVFVDTINTIMSDKEINEARKPGFDKWIDLAKDIYELYQFAATLRDDLIIFFIAHTHIVEKNGVAKVVTKTNGKMLTRLNLASRLSYNLHSEVERTGDNATYSFTTQSDGFNEARSSEGVFDYRIPNDMEYIISQIRIKDLGIQDDQ